MNFHVWEESIGKYFLGHWVDSLLYVFLEVLSDADDDYDDSRWGEGLVESDDEFWKFLNGEDFVTVVDGVVCKVEEKQQKGSCTSTRNQCFSVDLSFLPIIDDWIFDQHKGIINKNKHSYNEVEYGPKRIESHGSWKGDDFLVLDVWTEDSWYDHVEEEEVDEKADWEG